MIHAQFVTAVVEELRLQGAKFDRCALKDFLSSSLPQVNDDPDHIRWAYDFIEAGLATLPA